MITVISFKGKYNSNLAYFCKYHPLAKIRYGICYNPVDAYKFDINYIDKNKPKKVIISSYLMKEIKRIQKLHNFNKVEIISIQEATNNYYNKHMRRKYENNNRTKIK